MGKDIGKVVFLVLLALEAPEPIFDIPFGHEDFFIRACLRKGMDLVREQVSKLFS